MPRIDTGSVQDARVSRVGGGGTGGGPGTASMPAPPDVSGGVSNVPGGVDVRNENAPQIDALESQVQSLRNRIEQLRQRPTQQTLEQCRSESEQLQQQARQAVQVAYRLGIARVLRAIRQNS